MALQDSGRRKIFANMLFDVLALRTVGIRVQNYSDLFPLAYLYDNTHYDYDLESITMRTFPELASYKSRFHSKLIDNNFMGVETQELMIYNSFDSLVAKRCYNHIYNLLNPAVREAFEKIDVPKFPALVEMKYNGMRVDVDLLEHYQRVFLKH
jgi:DNA polymerase I-like protein with 3'-5' exonuclease and polymerase domains